MDLAIVGFSPTTHDLAFDRQFDEVWGMPWDEGYWVHYSRLFEMHNLNLLRTVECRPKDYEERLKEVDAPLYMQEEYKEFPCIKFPIESVAKITGDYFNSSIAYMVALAIYEEVNSISIFGVDMKDDEEYFYQRPNLEYLIGLAKGKGINIHIPEESPLCKFNPDGIKFGNEFVTYRKRYGNQ